MQGNQEPIDWELLQQLLNQPCQQFNGHAQQTNEHTEIAAKSIPMEQISIDNIFQVASNNNNDPANDIASEAETLTFPSKFDLHTPIIYYRTKFGFFYLKTIGGEAIKMDAQFYEFGNEKDDLLISSKGNKLILGGQIFIQIHDKNQKRMFSRNNIQLIEFSADERFVVLVDKREQTYTLVILDADSLKEVFCLPIGRFTKQQWPMVYSDSTNSLFFIYLNREVLVYETSKFTLVKQFNNLPTPANFSLSQARQSLYFSLVELKQSLQYPALPSLFQIWAYDDTSKPVIEQALSGAQEVSQTWSKDGTILLLWTQLLDDESNQSYYGVHQIYHVNMKSKELKPINKFDGPVHDLKWSPNSKFFAVISGFMPAGTVLFDRNGNELYLINQHHANTINWSPNSEYLCLGGFGNLPGEIEIWNIGSMKQIGKCKKDKVIQFTWSPDSMYFMVATLFPRLRVSNVYQIYTKEGTLVYEEEFPEPAELYDVQWSPIAANIQITSIQQNQNAEVQVPKKQIQIKKANFVKEMKGERDDLVYPIKLQAQQPLMQFAKKAEFQLRKTSTEIKGNTEKPQQQQQPQAPTKPVNTPQIYHFQLIMRRQTPIDAPTKSPISLQPEPKIVEEIDPLSIV